MALAIGAAAVAQLHHARRGQTDRGDAARELAIVGSHSGSQVDGHGPPRTDASGRNASKIKEIWTALDGHRQRNENNLYQYDLH